MLKHSQAIERVRDYLVNQIREIRSPGINAQIIQRQKLLKYKDIYNFLMRHHPQLAEEIGQAYINTMRWYYSMNFTRYRQALDKLPRYQFDKVDVIGAEQFAQRSESLSKHNMSLFTDPSSHQRIWG